MKQGYGQRIQQAILEMSAEKGERITFAEFGTLVGNAEAGRKRPYSLSGVASWIKERAEPGLAAFDAMEKVTGKPAYWFIFGIEVQQVPTLPLTPVNSAKQKKRRTGNSNRGSGG